MLNISVVTTQVASFYEEVNEILLETSTTGVWSKDLVGALEGNPQAVFGTIVPGSWGDEIIPFTTSEKKEALDFLYANAS